MENAHLSISPIAREDTYLVGYISAGEIVADRRRATMLLEIVSGEAPLTWEALDDEIVARVADQGEIASIRRVVNALRAPPSTAAIPEDLKQRLTSDVADLAGAHSRLTRTQSAATRNTDVYLTWDHMDVYFATSMRKRWEYEDLYDFVAELTSSKEFTELNVRHFDPTQSYDANRISKGLVESLMLKRAVCTVYSVQDTDTLGKDSELAATLAQGKPVIAYAPRIDVDERAQQLQGQRPQALKERLQFVMVQDEMVGAENGEFIDTSLETIASFESTMPWRSIASEEAIHKFREKHKTDIERLCTILASAEARIYNKRAQTVQEIHPLGIQVNLETGVANGVLVVRDVDTCARLVRAILTNRLKFDIIDDIRTDCWLLKEQLSNSVFRVVTRNLKLTNCFWNFYRHDLRAEAINE